MADSVPSRGNVALLIIDLMERIVALPTYPHSARSIAERCRHLARHVRAAGGTVVLVRTERPNVEEQPPGSQFVASIVQQPRDLVVVKSTWGAFHETALDERLRSCGVTSLWLSGIATNFGVESTARTADELGYELTLVEDCMAGLQPDAHEFAVNVIFPHLGTVTTSALLMDSAGVLGENV